MLNPSNQANAGSEYYKPVLETEEGFYFIEWADAGGGMITPFFQEIEDPVEPKGYVRAINANLLFEPKNRVIRSQKLVRAMEGLVFFDCDQDRSQALTYSFYGNKRSNHKPSQNSGMGKDYIDSVSNPAKWKMNSENFSNIRLGLLQLCHP